MSSLVLQSFPTALTQNFEYLVANQVPFRLMYNPSRKIFRTLSARSTRHAEHQVGNFVFVTLLSRSQKLDLENAVVSCNFELMNWYISSSTPYKDIIHLIVDESASGPGKWEWMVDTRLRRRYAPLYFIVFLWFRRQFLSSNAAVVRETCRCDGRPVMIRIRDVMKRYFSTTDDGLGLKNLWKWIGTEKRDFHGRKLVILPNRKVFGHCHWKG